MHTKTCLPMRLKSRETCQYRSQTTVRLSESGKIRQEIEAIVQSDQSLLSRTLSRHSPGEYLAEKVNPGAKTKLTEAQQQTFCEMIKKGAGSRLVFKAIIGRRIGLYTKHK